ncbi:MAG: DUF1573 domain-containing protein [Bacteroidota bacterium]
MKRSLFFLLITCFVLAFTNLNSLQAQTEKAAKPQKELKQVMKDLSPEMQAQVLEYAKRKLATQERLAARQATATAEASRATPAPEQAQAKPAPKPAQSIEVPQSARATTPAAPAAPKPAKPAYMEEAQSMAKTSVEWGETMHQFGKVTTGTKVNHTFTFKNTGDQPLKLTRVKASCGCTTPKWSKEEVAPGEEGFIDVSFNTSGKAGHQTKTVTVTGNFEPVNMVLRIRGEVERAAPEQK